jgi:ubiquitin-protein ligase
LRRLRSDLTALERLGEESSVLRFRASGKPVQQYLIEFHGKSLARVRGKISVVDRHEIEIKLGSSYPRSMPELRWLSPIYHPNISEIGMVCLGGYGTHWVPSLQLDELCNMLWDMARYHNYDVRSPYNRDAALWVANQTSFTFPIDPRPIRDLRAALGRIGPAPEAGPLAVLPSEEMEALATAMNSTDAPRATRDVGSRAGKYAEFVRKFASDLRSITPSQATSSPPPLPDGLILLDEVGDLGGRPNEPGSRPPDEIVFIE